MDVDLFQCLGWQRSSNRRYYEDSNFQAVLYGVSQPSSIGDLNDAKQSIGVGQSFLYS